MRKKTFLRDSRPDIFDLVKDKISNFNIAKASTNKIEFICPRCKSIVLQSVNNVVYSGLSCKKCGDGISFGEKFVFNVLEQLNINFKTHVSFQWSDKKVYDIGIINDNNVFVTLIEVHGKQHYNGGFETYGGRNREQEIENDDYKMMLANTNGFSENNYIVIDCSKSSLDYIKNSIENNAFFDQYDLDNINWSECSKNAISSYAIKAQCLWDIGSNINEISDALKINRTTVRKYLKQGAEIGICNYSISESYHRRRKNTFVPKPKTIMVASEQLKLIFYSISDASRHTGINWGSIYCNINGKSKYAGKLPDGTKITWTSVSIEEMSNMVDSCGFTIIGKPLTSTIASVA